MLSPAFFFSQYESAAEVSASDLGRFISVLYGSADSARSKSSLLFHAAYLHAEHQATRKGSNTPSVLYLCTARAIKNLPSFLPSDLNQSLSSSVMEDIQLKYVEKDAELRECLASIHVLQSPPSLLVLDDVLLLGAPPTNERELATRLAATLGHVCAALEFIRKTSSCRVLLSVELAYTTWAQDRVLHVCGRVAAHNFKLQERKGVALWTICRKLTSSESRDEWAPILEFRCSPSQPLKFLQAAVAPAAEARQESFQAQRQELQTATAYKNKSVAAATASESGAFNVKHSSPET
eukprot:gb/GEZN01009586.1/.p1 GENE.gb/GEZN01009586.1/~~gb/GEZN01009586.1/.p1  ORF type:complete len:294 (+),score=38.66 gb/GEZN01009586.1/:42-923(+)